MAQIRWRRRRRIAFHPIIKFARRHSKNRDFKYNLWKAAGHGNLGWRVEGTGLGKPI
jgi:hypothetical protein